MGDMDDTAENEDLGRYLASVTIGSREPVDIRICDYDPAWPERFRGEAARISAALAGRELTIEHIGSTAVPELAAKPIVDILLVVDDAADEDAYLPALEAAGYVLRIREPGFHEHRMLRTPEKDVHVHVFSPGSPEIERYRLLRDRLRTDDADRELYARTKRRLAEHDWLTVSHYAEAKTEVVEAIIARAGAARACEAPTAEESRASRTGKTNRRDAGEGGRLD
jgi:GrpB-like predicted nucleotidyltransferase (UPF0157 family)